MPVLSRREFGTIVLAGIPLAARPGLALAGPRTFGITTASLRELPRVTGRDNVDEILAAVRAVGATDVELALANVEPAPPSVAPFMGGSPAYPRIVVLSPEEITATNARARFDLRTWRLGAGSAPFDAARGKFEATGITVRSCSLSFDDSFTDEELDATFQHVTALGLTSVASPLTMAMAGRVAPVAERHGINVAIHNQEEGGSAIGTAALDAALALSPAFRVKLDVANVTASNADAVAALDHFGSRLSHVVVRDRLRDGGRSMPFGEGDTPIADVLHQLAATAPAVPVLVEYDYIGLRPAVEELAAALDYLRRA